MLASASRASFHVLLGNFLGKGVNYIALFICTPFLGPEGFAALLIVGIVLAVFGVIVDVGFEHFYLVKVNLVGPQQSDPAYIKAVEDMVFRVRLLSNLLMASIQIGLSWLLFGVYFEYPVDVLLRILSLNYLFNIFGKINEVRLKKRMHYNVITKAKIYSDIAGAVAKVLLVALLGWQIIGWVWGTVAGTFVYTGILMFAGRFRPGFARIPSSIKKDAGWFAKHSWFMGVGFYLQQQLASIIIKATYPIQQIGLYQFSYTYSADLQSGILAPQGQVLMTYFTNYKHDAVRIMQTLNRLTAIYFFAMGPAIISGIMYADLLIAGLLGPVWMPAVPIIRVLLEYSLFRIVLAPPAGLLVGLGKMKQTSILAIANAIAIVIALGTCYLTKVPLIIFTITYVVVMILAETAKAFWGLRILSVSPLQLLRPHAAMYVWLAIFAIFLYGLRQQLGGYDSTIQLTAAAICVGIFYAAKFWRKDPVIKDLFLTLNRLRKNASRTS